MKYRKTKLLSKEDAAYFAGLIDGEGTVGLTGGRIYKVAASKHPVVSIANTDYALVAWPLKITGVGFISKKGTKKFAHYKDSWIYAAHHDSALNILGQVLPYLKNSSKIRRSRFLLARYKKLTPRNGRYTDAMRTKRKAFEVKFLTL